HARDDQRRIAMAQHIDHFALHVAAARLFLEGLPAYVERAILEESSAELRLVARMTAHNRHTGAALDWLVLALCQSRESGVQPAAAAVIAQRVQERTHQLPAVVELVG